MNAANAGRSTLLVTAGMALLFSCGAVWAQDKAEKKDRPDADSKAHLTILVTAGDENKPVDSASVYVRYVAERKLAKNRKIEMNLKTNVSGVCHVPEIPYGRFLIQVIAPGWKTFGEYYEVSQTEQTINIKLAHPPQWY